MKTRTIPARNLVNWSHVRFALLLIPLACFALTPQVRADCRQGCDLTSGNTFLGDDALANNVGALDTAVGGSALANNTTGTSNTAIGYQALISNTTGGANTAVGFRSLFTTRGNFNIAVGVAAGGNLTTGSHNIDIGNIGVGAESNTIRIGKPATQTATFIAGISGATVPTGVAVIIDSDGHLGTSTSSARYKEKIQPMDKASEAILALQPVTFRYKKELDPEGIPQFGLVAEQVEKVNPDLVACDKEGKSYTVRYDAVNTMLLNEFLKEHTAFIEEQHNVQKLEAEVTNLVATVKEQAAQIQKVSAQLESSRPTLQRVAGNQ